LKNIHIRLPDGRVIYDMRYENYNDSDIAGILENASQSTSNKYWDYIETKRGTEGLVLGRWIKAKGNPAKNIGYLIIVVDEPAFVKAVYGNVDLGEGSELFILNDEGSVVSSASNRYRKGDYFSDKEAIQPTISKDHYDSHTSPMRISGKRYLVSASYITTTDWHFIGMIPYTYINSESQEVITGIFIVGVLAIVGSILLSLLIFFSIIQSR
jgi:two-component system sensor histidine kinase YesM